MADILLQHQFQVATPEDQHPVKQLAPDRSHPPLRVCIGPRRPHRRLEHLDADRGEDPVERGGELRVSIPDQEPEPIGSLAEVHRQVAGLLGHPVGCNFSVTGVNSGDLGRLESRRVGMDARVLDR
jgi:hypothetical protein